MILNPSWSEWGRRRGKRQQSFYLVDAVVSCHHAPWFWQVFKADSLSCELSHGSFGESIICHPHFSLTWTNVTLLQWVIYSSFDRLKASAGKSLTSFCWDPLVPPDSHRKGCKRTSLQISLLMACIWSLRNTHTFFTQTKRGHAGQPLQVPLLCSAIGAASLVHFSWESNNNPLCRESSRDR